MDPRYWRVSIVGWWWEDGKRRECKREWDGKIQERGRDTGNLSNRVSGISVVQSALRESRGGDVPTEPEDPAE